MTIISRLKRGKAPIAVTFRVVTSGMLFSLTDETTSTLESSVGAPQARSKALEAV